MIDFPPSSKAFLEKVRLELDKIEFMNRFIVVLEPDHTNESLFPWQIVLRQKIPDYEFRHKSDFDRYFKMDLIDSSVLMAFKRIMNECNAWHGWRINREVWISADPDPRRGLRVFYPVMPPKDAD